MPALELDHVTFNYPGTPFGVRDVCVSAGTGEMIGLLGPNGSGKSTLLKLFVGAEALDHVGHTGEVRIGGESHLSPRQRACKVAYLPQHFPSELAFTVRELVSLGRYPRLSWVGSVEGRESAPVTRAMQWCHVTELANRQVSNLSGGERQRVMLAAALAQDTDVLLLDEPTSALDLHFALQVLEILADLVAKEGKTVVLSSHDINLAAAFCSRLVVMSEGTIAADGPPGEVLTEALLADVYGVTARLVPVEGRSAPLVVPTQSGARRP